jgi:hypothetical protein
MRLVCLHADTVDALKRLHIQLDDLTPTGLWASQYHLVGLTPDQFDALELFQVDAEDVTPAQLVQAGARPKAAGQASAGGQRPSLADRPETPAPTADAAGREPARAGGGAEAEVPLAQARDGGDRAGGTKAELKPEARDESKAGSKAEGKTAASPPSAQPVGTPSAMAPAGGAGQQQSGQKGASPKGGGAQVSPATQATKKAQPTGQGGGQRYGTTRLRISVAGKYTEATVANGKIVVAGRSFDTPDQAAAELTKSRGDWTFWEYYDSADGKWRMLTRDWDTVLKSAAPGGR